ncbi:MAG: 4-hydroxybenzoate octaprenyltransferase [Verrucomicrobia bacterium]|nr:4-hydroxybenzoate octaprenyltransferase [Verrucomicrobiota bacterium]
MYIYYLVIIAVMNYYVSPLATLEKLVLFRQTLFGLPWVLLSALLAYSQERTVHPTLSTWLYIIGAFCAARFSGMCLNRIIDRHIDAKNPRTCQRALPRGEVSLQTCALLTAFFMGLFLYFTYLLGPLCFQLSWIIAPLLCLYSYTKRFTLLCHFVLGLIQFFGPLCAWVAVTGELSLAPLLLGFALFCAMAAGDIIYACQDVEFDRKTKLYSVPAKVGRFRAIALAKVLHTAAVASLFVCGYVLHLSALFYLSVALVGGLYVYSYRKVNDFDSRFAFTNNVSGITLLLCTFGEYVWRVLL